MSATLKYILGGVLLVSSFFGVAIWIVMDAAKYDKEHPIVCMKEGTIKEILAIENGYAIVKLENEDIFKHSIYFRYHKNNYHNVSVKPKDVLCLKYGRK